MEVVHHTNGKIYSEDYTLMENNEYNQLFLNGNN
jgi:hypothetical protein